MKQDSSVYLLLAGWGLVAGAAIAVQAGVNAQLARRLGHPALASSASFVIGTTVLAVYCLALRPSLPPAGELFQGPIWIWTGGLVGAFFVVSTVILAPRLGATGLVAVVIVGQLLTSLVLDQFGLAGFPVRAINWQRICGATLLIAGVTLILRT